MKLIFAIDRCTPTMLDFGKAVHDCVFQATLLSITNKGHELTEDGKEMLGVVLPIVLTPFWQALDELFDTVISVTLPLTEKEMVITRETLFDRWNEVKQDYELDDRILANHQLYITDVPMETDTLIPAARLNNIRQTLYAEVEQLLETELATIANFTEKFTIRFTHPQGESK